jgi:peptide/nickel transport system substrate-binding protein
MAGGFWHLEPENPRAFDIEVAKQKLEAAGYHLDANNKRLDKEGKPIALKMVVPDSSSTYSQSAEFITGWWSELGIDVTTTAYDGDTVTAIESPPEADPPGKADFDVGIWNWGGDVDPNSLLNILTTDYIPAGSDSFFSNPRYDELMLLQGAEPDPTKRKVLTDEMQQIMYDQAPYHVLFYDAALHAYRTDKFGGWTLQPEEGGLPFFAFGNRNYSLLTPPEPEATPAPSGAVASPGASPAASPDTEAPASGGGDSTTLILGGAALLIVIGIVAVIIVRRRGAAGEDEEA